METQIQPDAQEETSGKKVNTEKEKKIKKESFNWWQSLIILVATLAICLSAGYYVSAKYLWNTTVNQLDKQLQYYQSQVNQKPNDPNLRVQLGYTYFLKGDNDNAIKQYLVAKDLDKNNFDPYFNLAIVYDQENRENEALEMAVQAVKISPKDYRGQLVAGRCYRKLKMYKEATNALQEAAILKPDNDDILYEVGQLAEAQGKKTDAEKIYKEALSYDPTYKPAIDALDRLSKNK